MRQAGVKVVGAIAARALLIALVGSVLVAGVLAGPGIGQTLDDVARELDATGRFVEFPIDAETEAAIQRANSSGIAFVWLDQGGDDAAQIATSLGERLVDLGSRYGTIVVLNNDGVWVVSRGDRGAAAGETSRQLFAAGAVADGLDTVTDVISGDLATTTPTTTGAAETPAPATESDGGGGFPWFLLIIVAVIAFFGFRFFAGRRRAKRAAETEMEVDRAEIQEQLRDNADRVIELADQVIASGEPELIRTYEEASQSYQEVSLAVKEANDPAEIDRLDDRLDHAEWQFEVIEARLEGRPAPARPAPEADDATGNDQPPGGQPPPPRSSSEPRRRGQPVPPLGQDRPAMAPDESAFDRDHQPSPRRRSSGGGFGRMLGSVLTGMLTSIAVGQMRRRTTSRRTRRRLGGQPSSGGLGGGVLRGR